MALRRGDDVLNHMAVGTISGYFMAGFYGGAKALKIGMLGGALFGASFRLASQGFVDWREKKGEQLKQEREQVFAIVKKGFCN